MTWLDDIPADILDEVQDFNINYVITDPGEEKLKIARLIFNERERFRIIGYTNAENISQAKADRDLGCFHAEKSEQYPIAVYTCFGEEA